MNPVYIDEYGMFGHPLDMGYPQEFEMRRMHPTMALGQHEDDSVPFWWVRDTVTPGPPEIPYEYAPAIGESEYPTILGRHTEAFAEEMGIPFGREEHRLPVIGPNESLSTIPETAINYGRSPQGVYGDNFQSHQSLLMEPVQIANREEWPEGAIDYVSHYWGTNEVAQWDRDYRWIDGDEITNEYIRNREDDWEFSSPESGSLGSSSVGSALLPYENCKVWPSQPRSY